jgi:cellulose synthase/poly-beta-1,6-N-acetylglucosamine synthase-like glycosyltransferase
MLATSELIAFLEDDAAAEPTWIENLVRAYRDAPSAVGFGGAIKPMWEQSLPRWFPMEFSWVVGATRPRAVHASVRNVWGGNMLVRRQPFLDADGFRTGFGKLRNASEPDDTELCLRMQARAEPGSRWIFVPDAVVFHEVPPERRTWAFFLRRCWAEGRGKYALSVLAGPGSNALGEEAAFVRGVLTRGLLGNLAAALRGDPFGLARASAMLLGTAAAGAGFVLAAGQRTRRRRRAESWSRRRSASPPVTDITDIPTPRREAADT